MTNHEGPMHSEPDNTEGLPPIPLDNPSPAEKAVYLRAFELGKAMWKNETLKEEKAELTDKNFELTYEATHDELTGLLNLRGFKDALEKGRQSGSSVLFVDGTNIKAVNDKIGYEAGDSAIVGTAGVLSRSIRKGDVLARVGGDEFAILANRREDSDPEVDVTLMKARIQDETNAFLAANPSLAEVGLDIAVGSAAWYEDASFEDLKKAAEESMKTDKAAQHERLGRHR